MTRFRLLLILTIVGLLYVIGSVSMIFVVNSFRDDPFRPLENINPQHVLTSVVRVGESVRIEGTKCNGNDTDVGVEGRSFWREINTNQLVPYLDGIGVRPPGCKTFTFNNRVPSDLPPGTWRLEGIDIARDGTNTQQEPWFTSEFEVVE